MSVPGVLILSRCLNFRLKQSKTISRVMSCVIIYPMELSPVPLSDPPENMTGSHIRFLFGLASDGVYMAFSVTRETVVSYTAFPPLRRYGIRRGLFLLHWPGSHLHRTLSGILPYEARTFLTCSLSAFAAAIVCATHYRSILSCRKKNVNTYFPAHRFPTDFNQANSYSQISSSSIT